MSGILVQHLIWCWNKGFKEGVKVALSHPVLQPRMIFYIRYSIMTNVVQRSWYFYHVHIWTWFKFCVFPFDVTLSPFSFYEVIVNLKTYSFTGLYVPEILLSLYLKCTLYTVQYIKVSLFLDIFKFHISYVSFLDMI